MAESVEGVLDQVLHREPVALRLLNADVPRDLETICLKCFEKDPRRRYATARELAEELGRFLRGEPIHARPAGSMEKLWRRCCRKPAVASLSAATLLLLLAGGGVSTWQAVRAISAERQAKAEAALNEAVNKFILDDLLAQVRPEETPDPEVKLRTVVERAAAKVGGAVHQPATG